MGITRTINHRQRHAENFGFPHWRQPVGLLFAKIDDQTKNRVFLSFRCQDADAARLYLAANRGRARCY